MSIFNNPDFLNFEPLDLENKLYMPTSKLYSQTLWQLNSLYQDIKEVLINFHGWLSAEAVRFYEQPLETAKLWYRQTVDYGVNAYAAVTEQMWPKAEAAYATVMSSVGDFGQRVGAFWQAFYDHPQETAATWVEPVSVQFSSMIETSQSFLNTSWPTVETYVAGLYSAMVELFDLLMDQPGETLTALYQHSLSALLDLYFELVSSLLAFL